MVLQRFRCKMPLASSNADGVLEDRWDSEWRMNVRYFMEFSIRSYPRTNERQRNRHAGKFSCRRIHKGIPGVHQSSRRDKPSTCILQERRIDCLE
jgi:hypothetical protein